MRKFWESTTAQFGLLILSAGALAAGFTNYQWDQWMTQAVVILGIYASKEGIKYGSAAYQNKGA